ncbi:hypothetical protein ACFE04_029588 [Oxalis oulophora]
MDPSQPSIPISYPIKTLAELNSRTYFDSFHFPFNIASVPLLNVEKTKVPLPNRGRVLVCHDMKGGYTDDDKWIQGGSSNEETYAIWHWSLIDVFVYFSHSLVTIPPPCWTNTAHQHGVKVLGTFIAEWDEGRKSCDELLKTKESAHMYAERLAELAVALGFDGWLLNMEVELDVGQIPNLKEFTSHLTEIMHSSLPGSLVIWYDSVTIDGKLLWQNQLNEKNKPFFDISDGIFVNYTWQEDSPKLSAAVAGDRKFDVYMGIDTDVALDVLKKDNVSAAIFAPGWVYETQQPPDFQTAQNRWWSLVEKSWGRLHNYPLELPFYSNFDQGHGYHISVEGGQVQNAPWNNISSQSFQPILEYTDSPATIKVSVDFKEASYSGGGNITCKGTLEDDAYFTAKIFQGELVLGDFPLHFTYSVKTAAENSHLGLALEFSSAMNKSKSVLLANWETNQASNKFDLVVSPKQVKKSDTAPEWVIQKSSISMNGYTLTEIQIVCYRSKSSKLKQISDSQAVSLDFSAVLGHIAIKTPDQHTVFPPLSSWVVDSQYIKWTPGSNDSKTLSVKINWKLNNGDDSSFLKYNMYIVKQLSKVSRKLGGAIEESPEYLGVAHVKMFYVSDLVVPATTSALKFIIQVCSIDGTNQKLDHSPFLLIDVPSTT